MTTGRQRNRYSRRLSQFDKYFPQYKNLTDKLISAGKVYAEKNNINVKWDVKTSP